ncbi:MAG TPA: autotransporter-associated beta strand repeat-containing protein [Pseudomonadales bacterium]|nr:autotransporter-associated beta strand repeat-containing protein [Pseudomonadales bacterium]
MKKMLNLRYPITAILTALVSGTLAHAATYNWTGADSASSMNWNDNNNWLPGTGFPGSGATADTAIFGDTGGSGAATTVNNVVNVNTAVSTLTYTNITSGVWQVTDIPAGISLSATNVNIGGLTNAASVVDMAMTDGGTFNVYSNMNVGYDGSSANSVSTMNLGGLSNFIYSASGGTIKLGINNYSIVNCTLAGSSNNIVAATIDDNIFAASSSSTGSTTLGGGTNNISVGTFDMAYGRNTTTLAFPAGSAGGLSLTAANVELGYHNTSGSGSHAAGAFALDGGTVNIKVQNLVLGQSGSGPTGTSYGQGTVSFDTGTMYASNISMAINVGATASSGTVYAQGIGQINVGSATSSANPTLYVGAGGLSLVTQTNLTASTASTGTLAITNGTVICSNSIVKSTAAGLGTVNLQGGSLNMVSGNIGTFANPIDNLIFDNGTIHLNVNGNNSAVSTAVINGLAVSASGATITIDSVINVSGLVTIPLINYTGTSPMSGLTLAPIAGYTASLVDNGSGSITLQIQPAGLSIASLLWVGTPGGAWDIKITPDWQNLNGGGSATYTNQDLVAFDDTAANANVTLNTNVTPGSLAFTNSSKNYVISGTGSIHGGNLTLSKNGSGSLTLSESGGDSFGGGVAINAGTVILDDLTNSISGGVGIASGATLQIGSNDVAGNLPSGAISDNGSLIFNHSSGVTDTVASAISGNGSLTLSGSGTVALTVSNTYSGNTVISGGTLALVGSGAVASSANVNISHATLDLSGLSGSALPIFLPNNSSLNNATLTVGLANQQPVITANEFSLNGTITINVTALPPIASYPTTIPVAQAAFGIGGTYTLAQGNLGGYTGSFSTTPDHSEILLTLTSGPISTRSSVIWNGTNGVSQNINWSTAINWVLPGAPTPADNVDFTANGSAAFGSPYNDIGQGPGGVTGSGNITSFVDNNFTIGTLTYTNLSTFQNTMIASGDSLNVISNGSLTVGSGTVDFGGGVTTVATIGGATGTLNVNNTNGTLFIGQGSAATAGQQATLDLSGLGTFNATVSRVLVGVGSGSEGISLGRLSGVLYLAQTNDIIASIAVTGSESGDTAANAEAFDIGDADGNNSTAASALYLGQTNAIFADAIAVGRQKEAATMEFNVNYTGNNTAYFRGASTNAVGTWSIGDGVVNSGSGENANGTCDFTTASGGSDGYVNALVGTMYVGRAANNTSGTGTVNGLLSLDNGIISAGTLFIGNQPTAVAKTVTGTVNVNTNSTSGVNGTLSVSGAINIGITATGGTAATGVLNIGGGTVTAGTIVCGGTSTIALGNGTPMGTLIVTNTIGAPGAPLTTLTLNGGLLQLSPVNGATNIVATTVTISARTVINIASVGTSVGGPLQIPLISYTGTDPGIGNLAVGTIPTGFSAASFSDNGAGLISLKITAPPLLTWVGAVGTTLNSSWDIGTTPNWAAGSTFANNDLALFTDTASNGVVNLTTVLSPDSTTVSNNTLAYTFKGSGNIAGNILTKQGTSSLLIDNSGANNFSAVSIAGGIVQVGNNDANGSLGSGTITDNGSLVFDQNINTAVGNVLSGSGSLVQIGTNVVTLSAANSGFTGTIEITNGILNVTTAAGVGSGAVTVVTNGGSFDDNGVSFNTGTHPALVVSGTGYNGQGAIINNGAAQTAAFSNITVTANVTLGGSNRWDIRAGTSSAASLNAYPPGSPYSITKAGSNEVALVSVGTVDAGLGNIYVQGGEFAIQDTTAQLGNSASNLVVSSGAILELYATTIPLNKVITLNGNGTSDSFKVDNGAVGDNVVSGPITLNGNCYFDISAATVASTIQSVISGTGGLDMVGPGTLTLTAANNYTGNTTINAGVLALSGSGSIANSPVITVAGGATFNVSAISGFTLGVNQTLGNNTSTGVINGSVGTGSGTLALTYALGTPSLSVTNGTLTLSGSTVVTVNNNGAQLGTGTYAIITSGTGGTIAGVAPSSVTVTGNGAVGAASLSISGGVLNLVIAAGPPPQLHFTSINISGNTLTFSAINGTANGPFTLLSSTNLLLPVSQWTPVFTNAFDTNGKVNMSTNVVNPHIPNEFYLIETP